jgi:hypothetical protein
MALDMGPLDLSGTSAVLAGPIVRRLTRTEVAIWVAVRLPDDVTLHVRRTGAPATETQVTATPARIGRHLYVAVLEATGVDAGSFAAGSTYEYWFSSAGWPANRTPDWGSATFSYGAPTPTFPGLPAAVADLRLAHTSCRKPHGRGRDALATLDAQLDAPIGRPRPHLLALTGDQIYADDVAAPLVPRVRRVAADVIDLDELPFFGGAVPIQGRQAPTIGFGLSSDAAANHLWTFAEFCAMYLLAWSEVLWPAALPAWADVDEPNDLAAEHGLDESSWSELAGRLDVFRAALPRARRVLANVPTLMIFDDHEVTDDWNLDHPWAQRVYGNAQGGRIITNGLLAYAVFQHWGNVPGRFATAGTPEAAVLDAAEWVDATTAHDTPAARAALGVPAAVGAAPTELRDLTNPNAVRYDVRLTPAEGWPVQIVLVDERTARGYETAAPGRGSRVGSNALGEMIPAPDVAVPATTTTVVVAPAPIVGFHLVEHMLQPAAALLPGKAAEYDVESWTAFGPAFEALLDLLTAWERLLILSGDVHYGYVHRLGYEKGAQQSVAAQTTTSASKNADMLTMTLHLLGELTMRLGIERARSYDGFRSLTAAQRSALASLPPAGSELPWDDVVDVLLGRVLREGTEQPSVFSHEVADAYGFTSPDFAYAIDPIDDESLPTDPADLAAVQAIGALPTPAGWDPAVSYQIVRGLGASDRNRIGRVFCGLPQVCWVTFGQAPPEAQVEYVMAAGELAGDLTTQTTRMTVGLT